MWVFAFFVECRIWSGNCFPGVISTISIIVILGLFYEDMRHLSVVYFTVKEFCTSRLFGHNCIDSTVYGGVTIIVGIVKTISAASRLTIIARLARVSWDGLFLFWDLVVLVFSVVIFPCITEVSMHVKGVVGYPVDCCSGCCSFGSWKTWLHASLMLVVRSFPWLNTTWNSGNSFLMQTVLWLPWIRSVLVVWWRVITLCVWYFDGIDSLSILFVNTISFS